MSPDKFSLLAQFLLLASRKIMAPKTLNLCSFFLVLQSRPSVPDSSILQVHTKRVEQLPLMDFAATDFGGNSQEFGFEMGPACFY